jgi:hypothetical protein
MVELTLEQMISKIIGLKAKHKVEVTQVLPIKIGVRAVNLFVANFDKQGFDTGAGVQMWPEVERRKPGTASYKYPLHKQLKRHMSGILIRSGRGRRSVAGSLRYPVTGSGLIVIPFEVEAGYMGYHNEGGKHLPQRKFMGDSPKLREIIADEVNNSLNRIVA